MNTFDEIIQTKAYSDLTPDELDIVQELVSSEEEYNEMKAFYTEIDQLSIAAREEVSPSVKSSLNSVFQAKHPGIQQNWSAPVVEEEQKKVLPLYNRNWFRAAAILVVSSGVATVWFSTQEEHLSEKKETVQLAKMEDSKPETTVQKEENSNSSFKTKKQFPVDEAESGKYTAASSIPGDLSAEDRIVTPAPVIYAEIARDETAERADQSKKAESTANLSVNSLVVSGTLRVEEKHYESSSGYFAKAGMDADLNPMGNKESFGKKDAKTTDISTNDLLSLIEPSF